MQDIIKELCQEMEFCPPADLEIVEKSAGGYVLTVLSGRARIEYHTVPELGRALVALKANGTDKNYTVKEQCAFNTLCLMVDLSRNACMSVPSLKRLIRIAAAMGYNAVGLYTEDTFEIKGRPYFGYLRGRYSTEEIRQLDGYAKRLGVELIPFIQTLAHLNCLTKWGEFSGLFDINDILLCGSEETYKLIDDMFRAIKECYSTRRVNIGMDEAHLVGLGKYLDQNGYSERFSILSKHLARVAEIANSHGFTPSMWSDMFFRLANNGEYYGENPVPNEVAKSLPAEVELVYWDYHSKDKNRYARMIEAHRVFNNSLWTAMQAWKCVGLAPNLTFSYQAIDAFMQAQKEAEVKNTILCLWGDNGAECSNFAVLPALSHMAAHAYGTSEQDKKSYFLALTGMTFENASLAELPNVLGGITAERECPSKYFLYNDLFCGFMDTLQIKGFSKSMEQHIKRLSALTDNKGLGYCFETLTALCSALSVRLGLGVRTREAYQKGDKKTLRLLAERDYTLFIDRISVLHKALLRQWLRDNKPYGFEIHDIRLGGLKQRAESCRARLLDYAIGNLAEIPELSEKLLPFPKQGFDNSKHLIYYNWHNYVTVGVL